MVVSRVNCAGLATSKMGRDAATSLEIFDRRIHLRASRLRRDKQDVQDVRKGLEGRAPSRLWIVDSRTSDRPSMGNRLRCELFCEIFIRSS